MHGSRVRHSRRSANANANANTSNASNASNGMGSKPMEHLNLSLPLHVQVPPLPSPNTTAAAAALFRVNQLPPTASPTVTNHGVFSFAKTTKRERGTDDDHAHPHALSLSLPTPTTAAAAAAAMALSASSPASHASAASAAVDEHNKSASASNAAYMMAATSPDAASGGESSNRRRKVGIPKFLRFLFQMLEYEDQEIIAWSHDGTAFQIRDPEELAERVLPKYFKHNKVSSFQRQLNYFGFKKWTKTQTNICTFSHPCFVRNEQENMRLIKRKERSTRATGTNAASGASKHGDQEDEEGDEEQDELEAETCTLSDGDLDGLTQHQRPAKRAKVQPAGKQRPVSAARGRAASGVNTVGSKQDSKTKAASSKPPRAKKSPRGARGPVNEFEEELQEEEEEEEAARARGGRTMQLPTISPASSASTMTSSSFSRLVPHSGGESPPSPAYRGGGGEDGGADAAPVLPIHAEMMLQQNSLYGRRLQSGGASNSASSVSLYDSGSAMQDLSESFGVGQNAWQSSYGLSSFKFSDSSSLESSFDMGNGSGGGGGGGPGSGSTGSYGSGQQGGMTNTKDYLDVLLESANMDDQISAQSSVGSNDSGMTSLAAWEASYRSNQLHQQHQQHQHPHQLYGHQGREQTHANDRRVSVEAAMATYNMLSTSQSHSSDSSGGSSQMSMQLPSIEDLQGMRY